MERLPLYRTVYRHLQEFGYHSFLRFWSEVIRLFKWFCMFLFKQYAIDFFSLFLIIVLFPETILASFTCQIYSYKEICVLVCYFFVGTWNNAYGQ